VNTSTPTRLDLVAAVGLAIGGVFGLAGTFMGQPSLRQAFWAIDAVGLVVATALLTMKYFRKGNDCVAAGFLVGVAPDDEPSENVRHVDSSRRYGRCRSLRDHRRQDLLGRTGVAHRRAAAIARLSVPRSDLRGVDRDAAQAREPWSGHVGLELSGEIGQTRTCSNSAGESQHSAIAVLTDRRNVKHNVGVHMTGPVFSVVVLDCSLAIGGELHTEAIA